MPRNLSGHYAVAQAVVPAATALLRSPGAALCLCLCVPLLAQDSRITGRISDASGGVVTAAVVTATQIDSGSTRQVLSNAQGSFQLALPPGEYRMEAVKPGFEPLLRTGVVLKPGLAATVSLQMDRASAPATLTMLLYMCDFSLGSGCEMLETGNPGSAPDPTAVRVLVP
jgi:hypothetical protein